MNRKQNATVTRRITAIYDRYHRPEYIGIDPLCTLDVFTRKDDLEVAGLVAAVLSYGRVEIIIRNITDLFNRMDRQPAAFIRSTDLTTKKRTFKGFIHRFNTGTDIACFLQVIADCLARYGSLENLFTEGMQQTDGTMRQILIHFTDTVIKGFGTIGAPLSRGARFLIPSPVNGGASKRLNMYLRWMVRPADGIDRGVWTKLTPAQLIMPVDTHVSRIARDLGITERKTADWRMAEEITGFLRRIDPFDPVRFDFSLCRQGMVDHRKDAA